MKKDTLKRELDWVSMLVPLAIVLTVCALFMIFPEGSKLVLSVVRGFLGDDFGLYYALLGVGIVGCTLYIAFSKFGKIKLGDCEKPQYRSFQWGTMIFTSTMAADILFYSLCEWALYANESQVEMMGGMQKWASTYPLFHWGPIAWGFYKESRSSPPFAVIAFLHCLHTFCLEAVKPGIFLKQVFLP